MGTSKNAIELPANTWTNIVAVDGSLSGVETVVQNDGVDGLSLSWGGTNPGTDIRGVLLNIGDADYDTADAIWCNPGPRAGRVRVTTRS